jgi:hypothetical protein
MTVLASATTITGTQLSPSRFGKRLLQLHLLCCQHKHYHFIQDEVAILLNLFSQGLIDLLCSLRFIESHMQDAQTGRNVAHIVSNLVHMLLLP